MRVPSHKFNPLLCCSALWLMASLIGCGASRDRSGQEKDKPGKPAKVPELSAGKADPVAQKNGPSVAGKTEPGAAQVAPVVEVDADSATAAVRKTLKAIEQGRLVEAYDFLPPSYQSDVDSLIHEFAERMDAEVWNRLISVLRKSATVLRTKKEFLLQLDVIRTRPEAETLRAQWDDGVKLIDMLVTSDVTDLATLKQLKLKDRLQQASSSHVEQLDALGRSLGADIARQFAGVTINPASQSKAVPTTANGDTVTFQSADDAKPLEIPYVRHEGRWLPKSLVDNWATGIEADRVWLAALPDRLRPQTPKILDGLATADELLDKLLAANSREEFERAIGPSLVALALNLPRWQQLARASAGGDRSSRSITIVINRELTDKEQSALIDTVIKPLQEQGTEYSLLSNNDQTLCRITRIADADALRESLAKHFSIPAKAISLDADTSRMEVSLEQ